MEGCRLYSASNNEVGCSACNEEYRLDNAVCSPRIPNCASQNATGCLECADGFKLKRGRCVGDGCPAADWIRGCVQLNNQTCSKCSPGTTPI